MDSAARFARLARPGDRPDDALGLDFDGARFAHVGDPVTFGVPRVSFGIEGNRGLAGRVRRLPYPDVGGEPVAEAAGFEAILAGLREGTRE